MKSRRLRGEAAAIDDVALTAWQDNVLRNILSQYRPENIFNVDETALFWELLPSKTLVFKGKFCGIFVTCNVGFGSSGFFG